MKAAVWRAEAICDLLEMEPKKRKEILEDLRRPDMVQIVKKIMPVLRELSRPREKISYRNRRKEKMGKYSRKI